MFAGNFPPNGWSFCCGQLMPIAENDALFTLIGTTYGGDGEETFALPNLSGRLPMHAGPNHSQIGESGGSESVTLTTQQIPVHSHPLLASADFAQETNPQNKVFARVAGTDAYYRANPNANLDPQLVTPVGGSQPHENMQPFLCINFIISLYGIFPSQT
jgi:microcystin-dependent protein